jgi:hypothetical protein
MSVERANLLRCRVLPVENGSSVDMVGLRRGRASYYNGMVQHGMRRDDTKIRRKQ